MKSALGKNTFASYISQAYVALVSILLVPVYLAILGREAYGLVAFYMVLQACCALFDAGMSGSVVREVGRFNAGAIRDFDLLALFRSIELIFVAISLMLVIVLAINRSVIASDWLTYETLVTKDVEFALIIISILVSLRWLGTLYKSVIQGYERIILLSTINVVAASLKFMLVVPLLFYVSNSVNFFFGYQLAIALIEVLGLFFAAKHLLPHEANYKIPRFSFRHVKEIWKFTLSLALTSVIWVIVLQSDKAILSSILTLSDYAVFSVAAILAGGLITLSMPLRSVFLPRLTNIYTASGDKAMSETYAYVSQVTCLLLVPLTIFLAVFAEPILYVWTSDAEVAHKSAAILSLYATGNGFLVLSALPFYLQFAKGDLRAHVGWNLFFIALFFPLVFYGARTYGPIGTGFVWMCMNLLGFFIWIPIVHKRFLATPHLYWLTRNILMISGASIVFAGIFRLLFPVLLDLSGSRLIFGLTLLSLLIAIFIISALFSDIFRGYLFMTLRSHFNRVFQKNNG